MEGSSLLGEPETGELLLAYETQKNVIQQLQVREEQQQVRVQLLQVKVHQFLVLARYKLLLIFIVLEWSGHLTVNAP